MKFCFLNHCFVAFHVRPHPRRRRCRTLSLQPNCLDLLPLPLYLPPPFAHAPWLHIGCRKFHSFYAWSSHVLIVNISATALFTRSADRHFVVCCSWTVLLMTSSRAARHLEVCSHVLRTDFLVCNASLMSSIASIRAIDYFYTQNRIIIHNSQSYY